VSNTAKGGIAHSTFQFDPFLTAEIDIKIISSSPL
jgi:hypothetical protein